MKKEVTEILRSIVHPETGTNIVDGGMVGNMAMSGDRIAVTLVMHRQRDPFMNSVRKQTLAALEKGFPHMKGKIVVEAQAAPPPEKNEENGLARVKNIVLVVSGKGGVGKSTVASNLAVTLARMGVRTGLMDADIYGPSQPAMFGLEKHVPEADGEEEREAIIPAEAYGVRLMSIGFFLGPNDALAWRGPMATGALKQILTQTQWGELDVLLIDMPPGTGDIHLTVMQDTKPGGAVIVTTPQKIALDDARRGIALLKSESIGIPVLGIIENMAWFTPEELPDRRYYIFGKGGGERLSKEEKVDLLGQIPITEEIMSGGEEGKPASLTSAGIKAQYEQVGRRLVDKLNLKC